MNRSLSIFPVPGMPEIRKGDDLGRIILDLASENGISPEDGDVLVIAQKAVSKSEGCVHDTRSIKASAFARQLAAYTGHTPEHMELVLRGSRRIVRTANRLVISQTHHGFVMANSGVDASNSGGPYRLVTLPADPDVFARKALAQHGIQELPVTMELGCSAARLPDIHNDPFDRVILATAYAYRLVIVSKDPVIRQYPDVRVVW